MNGPSLKLDTLYFSSEIFENLSLHLDDVEFLHNAFIVQALSGFLVRFSNRGRYEPYVAKKWNHSGNTWQFQLHEGLTCEDGQEINAFTFKTSLQRSLKNFSHDEIKQTPFVSLNGINEFLTNETDSIIGISASDKNTLSFSFSNTVGKSLLEYLAMTPFSFICDANFENDQWKSRNQFVSSGPYKISRFDPDQNICELELRSEWSLSKKSPIKRVVLSAQKRQQTKGEIWAHMTYGKRVSSQVENKIYEVPRALLSLRLGINEGQYFHHRLHRKVLSANIREILTKHEMSFENYHKAESFFFGQLSGHETHDDTNMTAEKPSTPLLIRAHPPGVRPEIDFYQDVLLKALDKLEWPYQFMDKKVDSAQEFFNFSYDIAFDRSHVDATLDPDFVRILFKSKLGPKYQDPGSRVSHLVDEFDLGKLTYRDFLISFNSIISEEAAIIPLFHRGFVWEFSKHVDTTHISPLMSILRYDELVLDSNYVH